MPIIGYWIDPRGEVIRVSGAREHYGVMCRIFPDKPWEKIPQFMFDWAISRGWIRITNSIGYESKRAMTSVQGLRKSIYKQWETIYDLAVENNSKKIGVEYYDYGRDSYTEVDIEDAIKPPRPSVIAEENPRYGVGIVYRMENVDLQTPYHPSIEGTWEDTDDDYAKRLRNDDPEMWDAMDDEEQQEFIAEAEQESISRKPEPHIDRGFGNIDTSNMLFAFRNEAQARRWFNDSEWKRLEQMGFKLVPYKALEIIDSGKQVAFIPTEKVKSKGWQRLREV